MNNIISSLYYFNICLKFLDCKTARTYQSMCIDSSASVSTDVVIHDYKVHNKIRFRYILLSCFNYIMYIHLAVIAFFVLINIMKVGLYVLLF